MPPGVSVLPISLDEAEIRILSVRLPLIARLWELSLPVVVLTALATCVVSILLTGARPSHIFFDDAPKFLIVAIVTVSVTISVAEAWGRATDALTRFFPGRLQAQTLRLDPLAVSDPARGLRVLFSDIALVSDDAEVLLADGEVVQIAPGIDPKIQAWIAEQLREARARLPGSTDDVPAPLQAARRPLLERGS